MHLEATGSSKSNDIHSCMAVVTVLNTTCRQYQTAVSDVSTYLW